ncbi:MAG: hypothetical protein ACK5QX_04015 [bacterium]|jgi:hypothetical protein
MSKYNGHPSRAAWNVALWIANDEPLYRAALRAKQKARSPKEYAPWFFLETGLTDTDKTPDGYRFSKTSVSRAMAGL